jgi:hypothetical protein
MASVAIKPLMLSVIMLNVVMLNIVILNVVMLSFVEPYQIYTGRVYSTLQC